MKNILIIEDHIITAVGLERLIENRYEKCQMFHTDILSEALQILNEHSIDLVIQDINVPNIDSTKLLETILQQKPTTKVLMFSANPEDIYARYYLQLGAAGYLNKHASSEEIIKAIDTILQGKTYRSDDMLQQLVDDTLTKRHQSPFSKLTVRELEVLNHLLNAKSSKSACASLNLHPSSLGTHKAKILSKTGVKNLFELADLAKMYKIVS